MESNISRSMVYEKTLPTFLHDIVKDLMKQSLDMGTLLSNDAAKTRAYKERIKNIFQSSWLSIASVLEEMDLIVKCECFGTRNFCKVCNGSRYQLNETYSNPDHFSEVGIAFSGTDPAVREKLENGLTQAIKETNSHELR